MKTNTKSLFTIQNSLNINCEILLALPLRISEKRTKGKSGIAMNIKNLNHQKLLSAFC